MAEFYSYLKTVRCACLAACTAFAGQAVLAQTFWKPERAVEIVVTCQPGCGPDIAARTLQKIWQDHRLLEVPAVVVNKPGGGGAVAYGYLHKKAGDGHSMVLSGSNVVSNPILGRGVGYQDLTPLAMIAGEYVGVAVRADAALRSGRDVIDMLKKDPGSLAFGIANSLGNANHQVIALAIKAGGIHPKRVKNVVFQSGANSITALLGGHVNVVPASIGLWISPLKTGQVRLLAVSAAQRLPGDFAQVPTWREQGIDVVLSVWRMITAPPGLTAPQTAFWQEALKKTTATAEWKRQLEINHQSDEFLAGGELGPVLDKLHAQLKALLTDLELAK